MRYTVNRLHKELGKLIEAGYGRQIVTVDKESFQHNLTEVTFHELAGLGIQYVAMCDDDGGTKWNKNGTESHSTILILAGVSGANHKGELITQEDRLT